MFWLLGSFSGVRWPEFQLALVVVLAGWPSVFIIPVRWTPLRSVMMPPPRWALPCPGAALFTTTALITATIVSMAGSIGFVGLVVPHVMRSFAAAPHAADSQRAGGAILMVLADIASRMLIAPQSLPVGVVTALVGVPFFAVIIYRSRNK